jgi:hypothetical protein
MHWEHLHSFLMSTFQLHCESLPSLIFFELTPSSPSDVTRSFIKYSLTRISLANEMRTRGNERVSVRQGYGYGCRYGTLNEANVLKTARTCCSLEAWSADFRPFVHDLNTSRPNRQVRSASGRDFSPLRHPPSCSGRPVFSVNSQVKLSQNDKWSRFVIMY